MTGKKETMKDEKRWNNENEKILVVHQEHVIEKYYGAKRYKVMEDKKTNQDSSKVKFDAITKSKTS